MGPSKNVKWASNLGIFSITDEQHTGVYALATARFFFPENKMGPCLQWLSTQGLSVKRLSDALVILVINSACPETTKELQNITNFCNRLVIHLPPYVTGAINLSNLPPYLAAATSFPWAQTSSVFQNGTSLMLLFLAAMPFSLFLSYKISIMFTYSIYIELFFNLNSSFHFMKLKILNIHWIPIQFSCEHAHWSSELHVVVVLRMWLLTLCNKGTLVGALLSNALQNDFISPFNFAAQCWSGISFIRSTYMEKTGLAIVAKISTMAHSPLGTPPVKQREYSPG